MPGLYGASAEFGDFDGDGDLDILMGGVNRGIFRNDNGSFVNINADLEDYPYDVAWGDYDNDGDIDVLMNGAVYQNNGGAFSLINTPVQDANEAKMQWIDYDGDGDLDISQIAHTGRIFKNNQGVFTQVEQIQSFVGIGGGSWSDYNNDGYPDMFLTGTQGSTGTMTMYLYANQRGKLSQVSNQLKGFMHGSMSWGDYDQDGDDDLLLTGGQIDTNLTYLYKNQGSSFLLANSTFPGYGYGDAAWGDIDNDGDLDLALMGMGSTGKRVSIYRNNAGAFALMNVALPSLYFGGVVWGDYDNDGDLDLLVSGSPSGFFPAIEVHLFRNDFATPNVSPSVPSDLTAWADSGSIMLSWSASDDDSTPSQSLTYNVRIGKTQGGQEVLSAQSNLITGQRLVVGQGNAGHMLYKRIYPVTDGTYYWSVQALDNNFQGSAFSSEQILVVNFKPDTVHNVRIQLDTSHIALSWSPNTEADLLRYRIYMKMENSEWTEIDSVTRQDTTWQLNGPIIGKKYFFKVAAVDSSLQEGSSEQPVFATPQFFEKTTSIPGLNYSVVAWGDYDNDGDLDLAISGYSNSSYSAIFRNDAGIFVNINATLASYNTPGSLQWADFDRDGDLDLLSTGSNNGNNNAPSIFIYRNDASTFVSIATGIPNYEFARAVWGDYDNDGDLDIFVCGYGFSSNHSDLYRREGSSYVKTSYFFSGSDGPPYWIDVDNDGDLDIYLAKQNLLYRNEGNGFVLQHSFEYLDQARASWGDYDSDGDADMLVNGFGFSSGKTLFYRNNSGTLSLQTVGLDDMGFGVQSGWGDMDNDGDLDVAMGGLLYSELTSNVFRNNGSTFENLNVNTSRASIGYISWADVDNDGDLDLMISAHDGEAGVSKLYLNAIHTHNTPPSTPTNRTSTVTGSSVTLHWDKGTDSETSQLSLTYNVYVGNLPESVNIVSPLASVNSGFVKSPIVGNAGYKNSYKITNLKDDTYYWGVQTVDNGYMGSPFSLLDSFKIDAGPPAAPMLTTVQADTGSITIKWGQNNENDLLRYRIYAGRSPSALSQIDSALKTDTFFVWTDFVSGAPIFFQIVAVDQGLHASAFSNQLSVNPPISPVIRFTFAPDDFISGRINVYVKSSESLDQGTFFGIKSTSTVGYTSIPLVAVGGNQYSGFFDVSDAGKIQMYILATTTDGRKSDLIDSAYVAEIKNKDRLIMTTPDSNAIFTFDGNASEKTLTLVAFTSYDSGRVYKLLPDGVLLRNTMLVVKKPSFPKLSYLAQKTVTGWRLLQTESLEHSWKAQISGTGEFKIIEKSTYTDHLPDKMILHQNYPNPFNFSTKISFDIEYQQKASLVIYNTLGQKIKTLYSGEFPRGNFTTYWDGLSSDGQRCSSGIYFLQLTGEKKTITRRMLFLK